MTKAERDQLLCDYVGQLTTIADNLSPGPERDRVVAFLWAAGQNRLTSDEFEIGARVLLGIGTGATN